MEAGENPWKNGFGSPTPSSSSVEDEDQPRPPPRLSREAQLARDLDLYSRYDAVDFKHNPFTLAKLAATRQQNGSSGISQERNGSAWTEDGGEWREAPRASCTSGRRGTSTKVEENQLVKRRPGSSIPVANPDPGGRNDPTLKTTLNLKNHSQAATRSTATATSTASSATSMPTTSSAASGPATMNRWQTNSGWYDATGKPVPIYEAKKSLLESVDEIARGNSTRGRSKKSTTSRKDVADVPTTSATTKTYKKTNRGGPKATKSKKTLEKAQSSKIVFTRIPAGAGPTSQYPIVKGLNKQRGLPTKNSKATAPVQRESSCSSDSVVPLTPFQVQELVEGIAEGARVEVEARLKVEETNPLPQPNTGTTKAQETAREIDEMESDSPPEDLEERSASEDDESYSSPPSRLQQQAKKAKLKAMTKQEAIHFSQGGDHNSHITPLKIEELANKDNHVLSETQNKTDRILKRRLQRVESSSSRSTVAPSQGAVGPPTLAYSLQTGTPQTVVTPQEKTDTLLTMTHVSIKELEANCPPSSDLPYSSPLDTYTKFTTYLGPRELIANPAPVRLAHIGRENVEHLEDMVSHQYDLWDTIPASVQAPVAKDHTSCEDKPRRQTTKVQVLPSFGHSRTMRERRRPQFPRTSYTRTRLEDDDTEWSTLQPEIKRPRHDSDAKTAPVIKTTPSFRLSSKCFQTQQRSVPVSTIARTKLFVPSAPKTNGAASETRNDRPRDPRPFHEKVLRAIATSACSSTGRLQERSASHSPALDGPRADWRDQWKRASSSSLSAKYALPKPPPKTIDSFRV